MTRLAATAVYALVAALVLVAPLSASQETAPADLAAQQDPPPSGAPPEEGPPGADPQDDAPPDDAPPEDAPPEAAPAPAEAPQSEPAAGAPPAEAAPAPAPTAGRSASAAEPAAEERAAAAEDTAQNEERDRADRRVRTRAAASTSVTIRDFEFAPTSVTIDAGDTVTWNNEGPTPHSATADDRSFDTGILDEGQSGSHTFDRAGTFNYFCTPHPDMRATITVRAASAGGSGDDGGAGDSAAGDTGAGSGSGAGPTLPATGLDAGGLAVLGVMTLALGAWLRRRAARAG